MTDGFAPRLAPFYGGIFLALGIYMPFLPVWLAAKGLDSEAIGVVLAAPMVVRLFAVPLAARAADRREAFRAALIVTSCGTALGYTALGLAEGFAAILVIAVLAAAAFVPVFPLADAYALRGLARIGRAYGPIRVWGSVAFIVGNLLAGVLLDLLSARDLIWVIAAAFTSAALASLLLRPLPAAAAARAEVERLPRPLWRTPSFLIVAAAASLIQASHALYYGFSTIAWTGMGFDGREIGALWALGVAAEIVLFALSGRLPPAITPIRLIGIGAVGAVLRWSAMAVDPPGWTLPLLQCLHAFSFGATHLGSVLFLARAAPERLGATAQGYLSIALGTAMSLALALAGLLYGAYGTAAYGAMVVPAVAGGACLLLLRRGEPGRSTP
jgi:PPP family 3-phenylpropionic acid transporter